MYFPRLKDLRTDKDLLQKDIAEILRISQTVYSRYERGFQTIPVEHLITLADFYNTSADYILGRTNQTKSYKK
jgi:transcriptional regulator with XRE-family HTH domain